jgi:hypothetical protein
VTNAILVEERGVRVFRIGDANYRWNRCLRYIGANVSTLATGTAYQALGIPHLRRAALCETDTRGLLRQTTLRPRERYNAMLGFQIRARFEKTIAITEINRLKQRPLHDVRARLLRFLDGCRLYIYLCLDSDHGLRSVAFRGPLFSRRMEKKLCVRMYVCNDVVIVRFLSLSLSCLIANLDLMGNEISLVL